MQDPLVRFNDWLQDARACVTISEPTAMTLATATSAGIPSARVVLLKSHGPDGFTFYTNLHSHKSRELFDNPHASLCFYWMPLGRQVRIDGSITLVSDEEADAYFASRARDRQLGAWASDQSAPLANRDALQTRFHALEKEYEGRTIPRPPHWSGWRLTAARIEFWELQP
jgi:pyridoxamine 5'-phosphate oxidase